MTEKYIKITINGEGCKVETNFKSDKNKVDNLVKEFAEMVLGKECKVTLKEKKTIL